MIVKPPATFESVNRRFLGSILGSGLMISPLFRFRGLHFSFGLVDSGCFGMEKMSRSIWWCGSSFGMFIMDVLNWHTYLGNT